MSRGEPQHPVQPGEPAPDFTLPSVEREGTVSLADYRGKNPVLLCLFRGVFCPFCRRAIALMGSIREKLLAIGVEALGITATKPEHARVYYQYHPTRLPLAADPELSTHRAYGIPRVQLTPEIRRAAQSVRINPTGELPEPLPLMQASEALDRLDGFEPTEIDRQDERRQITQPIGQFLVDRHGIVRWINVEGTKEGVAGIGKFPTAQELLAATQVLQR